MRWWATLAVTVLVLAACSGEGSAGTTTLPVERLGPAATLAAFFDRLVAADFDETRQLVDESQLAVLTAIEGASSDEVAGMLAHGVPSAVRSAFWESFTTTLPALVEQTADRVDVGGVHQLRQPGFVAVTIAFPGSGSPVEWIVRDVDGVWAIDLFATFGPAFAPNLAAWFDGISDGEGRELIRTTIARHRSSFEVGLERTPLGPLGVEAVAGVEDLLQAVDG